MGNKRGEGEGDPFMHGAREGMRWKTRTPRPFVTDAACEPRG